MPNTHLADATMRLMGDDRAPSSDDVARAAAEGALALAYEQRTANNIAMLDLAVREGWADSDDGRTLRKMVVEALDLATIADLINGTYQSPADRQADIERRALHADRSRIMSRLALDAHEGSVAETLDYFAAVVFNKGVDA